jgi:hypothetical protein
MNRRGFLLGAAGFTNLLSALSIPGTAFAQGKTTFARPAAIAAWRRRIKSILDRGRLPIIDMEATYIEGVTDVSRMIEYMNEFDIAQIAFAPANAPTSKPSLDLHRQYPEYFIPTTNSGEFPRWWRNPGAFLAGVRDDLKSGDYAFMGEHEFRHYPSPEQVRANNTSRDINIDITGPAGQTLFGLSEEFGVAFQVHYEIEDQLLAPLETMLERYPKAKVIWCHLAMIRYPDRAQHYHPEYVASLIDRFPGLHFDLAVPDPSNVYRPSGALDSTLYSGPQLAGGWKALMEKYPDRFVSASDYRPPVESSYPEQIGRQRKLILEALSESTRQQVAYGNAWRLITGTPWRG